MPPKREPLRLATVGAVENDGSYISHASVPFNFLNGVPTTVLNTAVVANVNTNAAVNVGGYSSGSYTMNAKLGYIHIFDTLLNSTQIYNDFNASKSRFGF